MPIRRKFQFACPLLCFFFAAISAIADSPFIVNSWSTEDGLPQSSVISVIQTRDGYLWLGTLNGLVRFDGIHFTVFDEMNTPGLPSDRIVFLFEDNETNLWLGTESSGLAEIQNGIVTNFSAETAAAGAVTYAREDLGDILFYSDKGIARYHAGKINFYSDVRSAQLFLLAAHLIAPARDGGFWQLNGVVQKSNGNHLEKNFGACPWHSRVTAACEDENGNLIVGTLGEGIFWFAANGKFQRISKTDGLSSDNILSLCFDTEKNLWAGTDGGGLDRIKRKIFSSTPGLRAGNVKSVAENANGGLWAAFNASGLSYWTTNGAARDFGIGISSNAWAVFVDRKQNVWAGSSDEGLFLFQTNHFVPAPGAEILGSQIFALFDPVAQASSLRAGKMPAPQLWVGSKNGLGCWNGQNWKLFTTRDGLSENSVRAIAEDADSNLWIGTENGLNFFANGKFTAFRASENGLPGDDISCLYVDNENILWVGTFGHGLARFENGKWKRFSARDGLVSNSIGYIIGDDEGNLWIGSNAGLMRISKKSLADFSAGTNSFFCRVYGKADGLPTRECSSGSQPAAIRARDDKLWFPTIAGLVSIAPSELKPNLQPPRVLIESALVDKREQKTNLLSSAPLQKIVIPPGREQLEIDYTALNFSAPDAVRFKFRLEGRETKWTDAADARVARYADLPPGDYHFHVIACNEDGIWNQNGATLEIIALPQFWQTKTFRFAAIIFLLGIVAAIVRFISTQKLQRELQRHKQHEALERERSRIARDLHDQLGANLTQVALLGEMAEADKNAPEEIESHARQISQTARETTHSLDEIVWAINPSNDTLEGLANYACKYAQDYFSLANLRHRIDLPAQLPAISIPPEVRHNVFLAFKEAVHNVVKHAQATEVWIRFRLQPKHFVLEIEDNGRGIENSISPQNRNGLRNMKKRMEEIRGEFSISSGANGGTIVGLTVPI